MWLVALLLKLLRMTTFCVVYKLLEIYNMKCIIYLIYILPKGTGNSVQVQQKNSVITKSIATILNDPCVGLSWTYIGTMTRNAKPTYVVCVLLVRGHVAVNWKLQMVCTFGNQGLSSHSEETKRQGFWNS